MRAGQWQGEWVATREMRMLKCHGAAGMGEGGPSHRGQGSHPEEPAHFIKQVSQVSQVPGSSAWLSLTVPEG